MSIRKNRIACQGITNQSQMSLIANKSAPYLKLPDKTITSASTKLFKTSNLNKSKSKYDSPNMKLTTQDTVNMQQFSFNNKFQNKSSTQINGNQSKKYTNLLCSKDKNKSSNLNVSEQKLQTKTKIDKAMDKIKNIYKYNANVRKIIKAWGFQSKGCISDKQFHSMICKHFDPTITNQDCQQLFANVSGRKQNLDLLSFIKLVFDQQPFTKPHINVLDTMNLKGQIQDQTSNTLVSKIQDLNEGSLYRHIDKTMQKSFVLPKLRDRSSQTTHHMSNSFTMDSIHFGEKTQPSLHQTMHLQSNPRFTFSTTKSHAIDFTPTMFYGINQQKTRFSATPILQLNDQSMQQNKREKIYDEKYKVIGQIQNQQMLQKVRYQNKIQKIRQYQQKEKQNIQMIDMKVESRDQANMKRFREQNLAYNYVNFIHNDWK